MAKYKGTGTVASTDFKSVKWVGKTKGGNSVTISMPKAINMGNIDWAFAEKNDTVAAITFTGVYDNTNAMSSDNDEPFTIEISGAISAGASEILLGVGVFYIGDTAVALTRGGGSFSVAREFRRINADGDRGAVEGRVVMEASEPTLTLNALTILHRLVDLYPALATTT